MGLRDGAGDGERDGAEEVGDLDGVLVVGDRDGREVVGAWLGRDVVGVLVGERDGTNVGERVGGSRWHNR